MAEHNHQIDIVSGGTVRIIVAASLKRHISGNNLDIAIIEPSENYCTDYVDMTL